MSTVVVRSGRASLRTVAFLTPIASAVSTMTPYSATPTEPVPTPAINAAHRQRLAQPHECPPAAHAHGLVQGALHAGTARQVDAHQLEEGAERVPEASALLGRLTPDEHVGKEEAGDAQSERDPDRKDHRELHPCHTRGGDDGRNHEQPEHGEEHLVEVEALERLSDHRQVGPRRRQPQTRAVERHRQALAHSSAADLEATTEHACLSRSVPTGLQALQRGHQRGTRRTSATREQHDTQANAGTGDESHDHADAPS